jgi:hypothetical protein
MHFSKIEKSPKMVTEAYARVTIFGIL